MNLKIECLVCLKETSIPRNLNVQKYDGQITCRECGSLLQVKLVKAKVEQCKVVVEGRDRLSPGKAPGGAAQAKGPEAAAQAKREGRFYLQERT